MEIVAAGHPVAALKQPVDGAAAAAPFQAETTGSSRAPRARFEQAHGPRQLAGRAPRRALARPAQQPALVGFAAPGKPGTGLIDRIGEQHVAALAANWRTAFGQTRPLTGPQKPRPALAGRPALHSSGQEVGPPPAISPPGGCSSFGFSPLCQVALNGPVIRPQPPPLAMRSIRACRPLRAFLGKLGAILSIGWQISPSSRAGIRRKRPVDQVSTWCTAQKRAAPWAKHQPPSDRCLGVGETAGPDREIPWVGPAVTAAVLPSQSRRQNPRAEGIPAQ